LSTNISHGNPQQLISCHFHDTPFSVFCDSIYQKSSVKIYYKDDWTKNIKVNIDGDQISVISAAETALKSTDLKASIWHENIIILPGEKLSTDLPQFEKQITVNDSVGKENKELTETEETYITGRKVGELKNIRIGKSGTIKPDTKAKILGRIIEKETGEPIIGATLWLPEAKAGATSDKNGYFSVLLKPGKYNVEIAYMGFEKKRVYWKFFRTENSISKCKKPLCK
jgi:hypothetical protein